MSKSSAVATTSTALAAPLSAADLTGLLKSQGFASSGSSVPRISIKGTMLQTPDGEMYVYNPRKPTEPAMTARILKPLDEYNAFWIEEDMAREINRPDLAKTFSKQYYKEDQDRQRWPSNEVFDDLRNAGFKSKWSGDLILAIAPDDGQFTGEEVPHVLTLSTTGIIEFKGAKGKPEGSLSDLNFMEKLVRLAVTESGATTEEDARKAVTDALTSYTLGGVVAELRPQIMENDDKSMSWTVIVFDPIYIRPLTDDPLLTSGNDADQHGEDPAL